MLPPWRRVLPVLAVLFLGGCVSLEEAPIAAKALTPKERLLLAVYAAPGPVLSEQDSKAETGAKIVPGLGLIVKDMQDQRDLKASKDLQQYLPPFDAAAEFESVFSTQVALLGLPSPLIRRADTAVPAQSWREFNKADDELDWQIRYYVPQPATVGVSRNYSRFLALDDVVVMEVNLLYGFDSEDEQVYSPTLKAVTKLLRANTMHQLWRHENIVTEAAVKKTLYEYKVKPEDALFAWRRLMPTLGGQIAEDMRKAMSASGVALDPRAGLPTPSAPVVPLSGAGWAPAPLSPSAPLSGAPPPAGQTTASAGPVSAPGAPFTPRPSTP